MEISTRAENCAALFRTQSSRNARAREYGDRGEGHRRRIAGSLRVNCFDPDDGTREQYAALIGEARQETANRIGRKLRKMCRNYTPGALHHELHQERAGE